MSKKGKIAIIIVGVIVLALLLIKVFASVEEFLSSSYARYKKKIDELEFTEFKHESKLCENSYCYKKGNIIVALSKSNSILRFIVDNQAKYSEEAVKFIKDLTGDDRVLKLDTPIKKFINGYEYYNSTYISFNFDSYSLDIGHEYDNFVYSLSYEKYNKDLYRFNPHSLSYHGEDDIELVTDLMLDSTFVYEDNYFNKYEDFIRDKADDYIEDELPYFELKIYGQDNDLTLIMENTYTNGNRIHIMIDSGYSFGYIEETYSTSYFEKEYSDIVKFDIEYINKVKKLSIDVNKVLDYVKNALKEETKSYEDDSVEISVYKLEKSSKYAIKYDFKND